MAFVGFVLVSFLFQSCSKNGNIDTIKEGGFYSETEIQNIKNWLSSQRNLENGELDLSEFPQPKFKPDLSNTDSEIIENYFNGLFFLDDATVNGTELNYSYDLLIEKVKEDERVDIAGKNLILSSIQLSKELFTSDVFVEFSKKVNTGLSSRTPCNCENSYRTYVHYKLLCEVYGGSHCFKARLYYNAYLNCLEKEIHCPPGFVYDGANCYSGVHFPEGYEGFIWGNGFYTKQNCKISTENDCCPGGFGFDGANCHYWGLYFPSDYEPFIWHNTFYVKPKCY